MSNLSFLAAAEQIICRTPPLASSERYHHAAPEGQSRNKN